MLWWRDHRLGECRRAPSTSLHKFNRYIIPCIWLPCVCGGGGVEARVLCQVYIRCLPPSLYLIFWDRSLNEPAVNWVLRICQSPPLYLRVTGTYNSPQIFAWLLRSKLRPPCCAVSVLTHWAITPGTPREASDTRGLQTGLSHFIRTKLRGFKRQAPWYFPPNNLHMAISQKALIFSNITFHRCCLTYDRVASQ